MTRGKIACTLALGFSLAGLLVGQDLISAQSGLIHYTEGEVLVDGSAVKQKPGDYPSVKKGQRLKTVLGRAEILLTPGVFLRLSENSEIVMIGTALTDTRIEVAEGSVILEAGEIQKAHAIELSVGGSVLEVKKRTVFRVDAGTPPRVRVYDGEVTVAEPGRPLVVKEGRQLAFTSVPVVEKFAKDETDAFYRWAGRRSGYLAMANMAASRRMHEHQIPWQVGGWYYSPYFGMYTYVPLRGRYVNTWNHAYHAPAPIYQPQPQNPGFDSMNSSRGYSDMSGRGYSGGGGYQPAATAPSSSAPAPAPAEPRGADSGGGSREGGGGRR